MATVLLIIHLLIAIALVGVILLQKSEGGALGIGGGGGGGGGFMSGRGQANLLTRTTAFLAAGFITTSLLLAILASRSSEPTSILDEGGPAPVGAPLSDAPTPSQAPAPPAPVAPPVSDEPPAPAPPSAPIAD